MKDIPVTFTLTVMRPQTTSLSMKGFPVNFTLRLVTGRVEALQETWLE